VKLTTHLHLVPRSKNEWSYTSTPQYAFMAWCLVKSTGTTLPLPTSCVTFRIKLSFMVSYYLITQLLIRKTTPFQPYATAYSIHSQLPSIPGGRLLHPQPEDASCRCETDPYNTNSMVKYILILSWNLFLGLPNRSLTLVVFQTRYDVHNIPFFPVPSITCDFLIRLIQSSYEY